MITIYQIDIQNCNNWPLLCSISTNKSMHQKRLKSYKKRLKSRFQRRFGKEVNIVVRYKEFESKYNERNEK